MKFTETLFTHLTPEWRTQYMNYEALKALILEMVETARTDSIEMKRDYDYYDSIDEEFYYFVEKELQKVNSFFAEKLAEVKRKFLQLKDEISGYFDTSNNVLPIRSRMSMTSIRPKISKRRLKQLKLAFSELYLSLILLQNFQNLNYTGFRKILKKHDKLLRSETGARWFQNYVEDAYFYRDKDILNIIQEVENIYVKHLEGGDRKKAMKRLRVPPFVDVHQPWTTFRVGLFSGAMIIMSVVIYFKFIEEHMGPEDSKQCLRLFRPSLLMTLHCFLYGANVHGWRTFGVNNILIFELDPRHHLTSTNVMEMATGLGVLWTVFMLGFLYNDELGVPPYVFPIALYLVMLAFLLNPIHIMNFYSRYWFIRLILRVVCAPFFHVGFADFWFGDQLNSLTTCVTDLYNIICFYCTNNNWWTALDPKVCMENSFFMAPIVRCLPAWFRFAQCLRRYRDTKLAHPFLTNALKYATTFPSVGFQTLSSYHQDSYTNTLENPYVWGYLIFQSISTVYCLAWDFIKDFGVFQKWSGENILLRGNIVYPQPFYYFVIIENFILRFFWVIAFYLTEIGVIEPLYMTSIQATLEVIRRYIWNYIRLENEHLYNCGMFRAVRDISVAPIYPKDQQKLQRMMDLFTGVTNRRKKSPQSSLEEDDKED